MNARPALQYLFHWPSCRALPLLLQAARTVACFSLVLVAALASAGSFSVNPVRVELSSSQASAVIRVENNGNDVVTVEARTMSWAQANGKDQLTPTREVLVTPQVFRLKPGATQVLRIGALRKPDSNRELPYRLLLEEIPPPPSPDFKGLQVALRISMPVFLKPLANASEKIDVSLKAETDQKLRLTLSNSGQASAQFSDLALFYEDMPDRLIASQTTSTYVLPGQQRELLLNASSVDPDKKMMIRAKSHAGPVEFHAVTVSR